MTQFFFFKKFTANLESDHEPVIDNANDSSVENLDTSCNDTDEECVDENDSKNIPKKVSGRRATTRKKLQSKKTNHDHQEIVMDKEKAVQCDICQEMFHSQRKLVFHKKMHEKDPYDKKLYDQFIAENFDMTCDQCDEKFTTFQDARRHYKDKHNEEQGWIKCCRKKLKSPQHIRDHIKKHLNPETFK